MNRDDIIRMAREAGDVEIDRRGRETFTYDSYGLERFAALVSAALRDEMWEKAMKLVAEAVAAEREACALLCEQQKDRWVDGSDQWGNPCPARLRVTPSSCAAAIRTRGQDAHT